ncbi:hypothetical protein RDWZM_006198 [Blomia tropicalis]|uniref:Flap endonuclease 1 n=1 Tax=Blomia tropicalis TaxID=40697 RepID=A0A9Q0RN51_BLOTA|nr:hypothetical protein RDWZM_006198 [Blomia tropicalis]
MGILGMTRLIADVAPEAIKEADLKSLFGRRIAIDASMCIYQFLIAIRSNEYMMTNDAGETTSHLVGLFYRSIKLLETGIKPVYVFDGKAPKLKCGELIKRAERRNEAKEKLEEAKEIQNLEEIQRFNKRLVRVTRQMNEDCKKLLTLLGLPVVQAPSEAEAQCVQLCKEGLVYAAATEDMDALTFGCTRLVRNLTSANNEKIRELQIEKVLKGLELTQDEFIDLSILMGCDYCSNIKGIGPKTGHDLIKKYGTIEKILEEKYGITEFAEVEVEYDVRSREAEPKKEDQKEIKSEEGDEESESNVPTKIEEKDLDKSLKNEADDEESKENINLSDLKENEEEDYEPEGDEEEEEEEEDKVDKKSKRKVTKRKIVIPENWPFRGARKLFQEPMVLKDTITEADLKMKDIDEDGLIQFLCIENGFSEDRVRAAIKRAKEAKGKSAQTRIDSFFKMKPSTIQSSSIGQSKKRSGPEPKGKTPAKRGRRGR